MFNTKKKNEHRCNKEICIGESCEVYHTQLKLWSINWCLESKPGDISRNQTCLFCFVSGRTLHSHTFKTNLCLGWWMDIQFITNSLVSQVIKGLQKPGWRVSIFATAEKKKSLLSLHSKGHLILSTHTLKSLYKSTSLVPMIGPLFIGVPLSSINLYSWATKWSFSSRGSSSEL